MSCLDAAIKNIRVEIKCQFEWCQDALMLDNIEGKQFDWYKFVFCTTYSA